MTNTRNKSERANLVPTPGVRNVTTPKRGRGRPRKNSVVSPAPVADPVMEMVEDYRITQNEIKVLTQKFAFLKDALTRHLVAGNEDKIELPDGSFVISKVMTKQWTYSEEVETLRTKLKEQKLDLEHAEKKEQLKEIATFTYSAHVRGSTK